MPTRMTKRSAELAEKRARRAELLEKAESERRKARKAAKESTRLRHIAAAKRYEADAYAIRLRRKRSGRKKNKGLLESVGDLF
jgi:hypothetical protein